MKIWSDVEYVYRCLADVQRTGAFERAIAASVKKGDVVLDLGTGSGIMALLAARAGARRVYAIEIGDYLSRTSRQIFADNGFADCIALLRMDARDVTLESVEKPDVVICEMVTTGLIGEMQAPVINLLKRRGVISEKCTLIPSSLDVSASLVHVDYTFFGFQMRFPIFVDYFSRNMPCSFQKLSDDVLLHRIEFAADFKEAISVETELPSSRAGKVNGLLLKSKTTLPEGQSLEGCVSYCQPVIMPIPDLDVEAQQSTLLSLVYELGEGFDKLKYNLAISTAHRLPKLISNAT
jgi:predicted RNA methylase